MTNKTKLVSLVLILAGALGIGKTIPIYIDATNKIERALQHLPSKYINSWEPLSGQDEQNPVIREAYHSMYENFGRIDKGSHLGAYSFSSLLMGLGGLFLDYEERKRK